MATVPLTFGRTTSLALDVTSVYDFVASTAFSSIGFSAAFSGFGSSPSVRPNTAVTYRLTYQNFRAAVQAQVGSYGIGNSTNGMYQGQLGLDFGSLSVDGVLSWAKDAVSLSSFGGSNIACITPANCFINVNNQFFDPNTVLKATLSNNLGGELVAKYKWDPFTFYGGWIYARQMNPSDDFLTGFPTIEQGIFIPPGFVNKSGVATNQAVTVSNFDIQKVLNTFWFGARWKIRSDLEAMGGFYYQNQNNFNAAACTGSGAFISSSKCGGSQSGLSFLLDWKPVKRVDIYAGVLLSNVYGGLANGFFSTSSVVIPGTAITWSSTSLRPGHRTTTPRSASVSAFNRGTGARHEGRVGLTVNPACCRRCNPCCSRPDLRSVRLRRPCHRGRARYAARPSQTALTEAREP